MFNGKYVSIGSILATVVRYPFVEGINKEDVALYLSNFLRLIGSPIVFKDNVPRKIEVKNFRAEIPEDMIYLKGIRYSKEDSDDYDTYIPMKYASDIYHAGVQCDDDDIEYCGKDVITYILNDRYIQTSEKDGFIQMTYESILTDEEGLPMVPDDVKVKEALKYYILWQYAEPAYYRKDVPKDVFHDIKQQYMWYIGAATNSLNMPSPDQMKTLEDGLIRLIKSSTQHETTWKRFAQKERLHRRDNTQRLF